MLSLGHDHFIRSQSPLYHHKITDFGSGFDKPFLGSTIPAHNINMSTSLLDNNCAGRYHYGVFAHIEQQFDFGKLSGQQFPPGIGQFGSHPESTCLGIDLRLGKVDQALLRINRIIGQGDRNRGLPGTGSVLLA